MQRHIFLCSSVVLLSFLVACFQGNDKKEGESLVPKAVLMSQTTMEIIPGAERVGLYYNALKGKKIGVVAHQCSVVGEKHLIDTLLEMDIDVQSIFAVEHGFKGKADNGEEVKDSRYRDVPVISVYGKNKKPKPEDVKDLDYVVFDMQDVGARFYTYISTLHYFMETCAEVDVPMMIMDRPNPNGYYVDGPVLEDGFNSFIGMHKVPVVYGMSIGEYAQMINGEYWHHPDKQVDLTIVPCKNYDHTMTYDLPIAPSPNLPNHRSVILYPSLCFFEGTTVSIGRGTDHQFQIIGHPARVDQAFQFTPVPSFGSKHPKLENQLCYGHDLTKETVWYYQEKGQLNLHYLLDYYQALEGQEFFLKNMFFDKLAGTDKFRKQIVAGQSEQDIRKSWEKDIVDFKNIRKKYLLYKDFEEESF